MMRLMVRILAASLALTIAAGSASAADRRYSVTDFDRVVVEGPYTVRLTVGRPSAAVGTGAQAALEGVTVDVQGTTLRIRRNANAWGGYPGRPPAPATIALTTRNLRSARLAGTGSLSVEGARGLRVEFSVEGSGRLAATGVAVDNLALAARGAGTMEVVGTARALTVQVQGAATLQGSALTTETATVAVATSGDVLLNARRSANVTANGLGRVEIAGNPACTLSGTQSADVRCGRQR